MPVTPADAPLTVAFSAVNNEPAALYALAGLPALPLGFAGAATGEGISFGVAGGVRDAEVVVGEQAAVVQARAQTRVLLHRKAVALGQGQHEMVGVVELQA